MKSIFVSATLQLLFLVFLEVVFFFPADFAERFSVAAFRFFLATTIAISPLY